MRLAVQGYLLSLLIGCVIGGLVARVAVLRSAFGSLITGIQTMPSVAWVPWAILLFRQTDATIIFVIVLGTTPAIANGLIAGSDQVPPLLIRAGRAMGARGLAAALAATSSCRRRCRASWAASSRAGRSPGAA